MKKHAAKILNILWCVLPWVIFPCASFYLMETFHHNPFENILTTAEILNIIIFVSIALLLWTVTGSRKWAFRIESIAALIIGLANYYVIEFRGIPILPWDIFSIKTAATVGGDYSYALEVQSIFSIFGFILLFALESLGRDHKLDKKLWRVRVAGACGAAAILMGEYYIVKNPDAIAKLRIYDKLFTPYTMTKRDGIALAFMMELQYMDVEKPDGYSTESARQAYESLEADTVTDTSRLPNIIVVMNEAFSDLSVLGDFETNEDYAPVLHSLQKGAENTVTGTMNVSVVGGNTANTEFEFLTGASMTFLPDGCIPYQQYINKDTDNMAAYLKSLGYRTVAMHPYNASGWERNEVYPRFQFDDFYSLKNFSNTVKVRDYVSDDSCVDRIIEEFEKSEEPCFIFNVTMQNHSPYTAEHENFTPDITVDGSESMVLSRYLSLIKLSDAALGRLIAYFQTVEEDTVIVFFGDHQPADSVVKDIWTLNGTDPKTLTEEEECRRYQVPFVVWANYEIEQQTDVVTSANFWGAEVFDWCDIPKSGYQNFLLTLKEDYTAISSRTILDKEQKILTYDEVSDDLWEYSMLQYYRLFQ